MSGGDLGWCGDVDWLEVAAGLLMACVAAVLLYRAGAFDRWLPPAYDATPVDYGRLT